MAGPLRVVVCDDAVSFPVLLRHWLEEDGDIEVAAVARTGADVLERTRAEQPDVVVLDLLLPDVPDTAALVGELRDRAPGTAVLLCSGMLEERLAVAAADTRVDGHLTKARTPEEFRRAVRRLAGRAQPT